MSEQDGRQAMVQQRPTTHGCQFWNEAGQGFPFFLLIGCLYNGERAG